VLLRPHIALLRPRKCVCRNAGNILQSVYCRVCPGSVLGAAAAAAAAVAAGGGVAGVVTVVSFMRLGGIVFLAVLAH
jgi:hypothetical protein